MSSVIFFYVELFKSHNLTYRFDGFNLVGSYLFFLLKIVIIFFLYIFILFFYLIFF